MITLRLKVIKSLHCKDFLFWIIFWRFHHWKTPNFHTLNFWPFEFWRNQHQKISKFEDVNRKIFKIYRLQFLWHEIIETLILETRNFYLNLLIFKALENCQSVKLLMIQILTISTSKDFFGKDFKICKLQLWSHQILKSSNSKKFNFEGFKFENLIFEDFVFIPPLFKVNNLWRLIFFWDLYFSKTKTFWRFKFFKGFHFWRF